MRTGRKWTFFTAGIAALSFGLDAIAQKHSPPFPGRPDFVGGPRFEPRQPPGLVSGNPGKGTPLGVLPVSVPASPDKGRGGGPPGVPDLKDNPGHGGAMPETSNAGGPRSESPSVGAPGRGGSMPETANAGGARGESPGKDAPGHGGAVPDKSNRGGSNGLARGKDDSEMPGENIQVSASQAENPPGRQRQLHEIPSCH